MAKKPKWSDDDALAKWVDDVLEDRWFDDAREEFLREQDGPDGIPASEIFASLERAAINAAEDGNMCPLADLIDPSNPLLGQWRAIGLSIGPHAESLIADYLRGKRSKRRRGRPKQSIEEREASTPVHLAAKELVEIRSILDDAYPAEKGIQDRAISIVAKRAGISMRRLENYLKKPSRHLP